MMSPGTDALMLTGAGGGGERDRTAARPVCAGCDDSTQSLPSRYSKASPWMGSSLREALDGPNRRPSLGRVTVAPPSLVPAGGGLRTCRAEAWTPSATVRDPAAEMWPASSCAHTSRTAHVPDRPRSPSSYVTFAGSPLFTSRTACTPSASDFVQSSYVIPGAIGLMARAAKHESGCRVLLTWSCPTGLIRKVVATRVPLRPKPTEFWAPGTASAAVLSLMVAVKLLRRVAP